MHDTGHKKEIIFAFMIFLKKQYPKITSGIDKDIGQNVEHR